VSAEVRAARLAAARTGEVAGEVEGWEVVAREVAGWEVVAREVEGWEVAAREVEGWEAVAREVAGWEVVARSQAEDVLGWSAAGWVAATTAMTD